MKKNTCFFAIQSLGHMQDKKRFAKAVCKKIIGIPASVTPFRPGIWLGEWRAPCPMMLWKAIIKTPFFLKPVPSSPCIMIGRQLCKFWDFTGSWNTACCGKFVWYLDQNSSKVGFASFRFIPPNNRWSWCVVAIWVRKSDGRSQGKFSMFPTFSVEIGTL